MLIFVKILSVSVWKSILSFKPGNAGSNPAKKPGSATGTAAYAVQFFLIVYKSVFYALSPS